MSIPYKDKSQDGYTKQAFISTILQHVTSFYHTSSEDAKCKWEEA